MAKKEEGGGEGGKAGSLNRYQQSNKKWKEGAKNTPLSKNNHYYYNLADPQCAEYEDQTTAHQDYQILPVNKTDSRKNSPSRQKHPLKASTSPLKKSPFKDNLSNPKHDEERQQLIVLLQECSKNIEKIEFRPSLKKQQLGAKESSNSQSPVKQSNPFSEE
jgi:hypothetical protein